MSTWLALRLAMLVSWSAGILPGVRANTSARTIPLRSGVASASGFLFPPLLPNLHSNLRTIEKCSFLGCSHRDKPTGFARLPFLSHSAPASVPLQRVRKGIQTTRLCVPPEYGDDFVVAEDVKLGWVEQGRRTEHCFDLEAPFEATGDQPEAIEAILRRLQGGSKFTVLRGATGTGKTFAVAQTIHKFGKPTLIMCHNKTLAAQLARELRAFFPRNCVELFVSYYNFYQPEAYISSTDTYISKISSINQELDALRHRATRSVFERDDVIVVASVSCIYGLGLPTNYINARIELKVGHALSIETAEESLLEMLYAASTSSADNMQRGQMLISHAARSSDITVWPPYEDEPLRLSFADGQLVRIERSNSKQNMDTVSIYPARHHVTPKEQLEGACERIEAELNEQLTSLRAEGNTVAAEKLEQRTRHDLELIRETGFCQGMENYSRHLAGRQSGEAPDTLVDYLSGAFGDAGWLLVIDESHVTIPQLKGMFAADRARKLNLVRHGFRLPSALDNRPLNDAEFWSKIKQGLFVSATPGDREVLMAAESEASDQTSSIVDMVIRPTNVLDPEIEVWPKAGQLHAVLEEIQLRVQAGDKALVMTVTKRDAEDLGGWLLKNGVTAKYLHSGLTTVERAEVLEELQRGELDVLVGVNLLREGLDLPQVSLVVIMDADKEGFLRSSRSLIQTIGRAARNARGKAVFIADRVTPSMQQCIDETYRRRRKQSEHNERHNLEPITAVGRELRSLFEIEREEADGELEASVEWARWRPTEGDATQSETRGGNDLSLRPSPQSESTAIQPVPVVGRAVAKGEVVATRRPRQHQQTGEAVGPSEDKQQLTELREKAKRLPTKTGVYLWMTEQDGKVLYVGKAKSLRSRVMSYVKEGDVGSKISALRSRATHIDYVLTPGGEHDALLLEGRLIKQHRPPYNVLLTDDKFYPYICVTLGDEFPTLFSVHRKDLSRQGARYFGPFTNVGHLKLSLRLLEAAFSLRSLRFQARHGLPVSREQYLEAVGLCMQVLEGNGERVAAELEAAGKYAEASAVRSIVSGSNPPRKELNFLGWPQDSPACDVVATAMVEEAAGERRMCVVQLMQLREGAIRGRFSFLAEVPSALEEAAVAEAMEVVLEQHYIDAEPNDVPALVLTQHDLPEKSRILRLHKEKGVGQTQVRSPRKRGKAAGMDRRAVELAGANAAAEAQRLASRKASSTQAARELADLLRLPSTPVRIEAYDISHLQGQGTVASRVVFINGEPAKNLYRTYNIRSVDDSPDDYAAMEEAIYRRFRAAMDADKAQTDEANQLPDLVLVDGGKGQLSAALRGLRSAGCGETPICALAKREEEVFVAGRSEPLPTSSEQAGVLLLRAARDESHRFALQANRRRRRADMFRQ